MEREAKASVSAGTPLRLVVFLIDGTRYALALSIVERVLPMVAVTPVPGAPSVILGAINLGGHVVVVADLRRRLDLPPRDWGPAAHLLMGRTARRTLAVPIDDVLGVSEVAPEEVTPGAVFARPRHVAGIVALADGLLFIHDLDAFLSLDEEQQLDESLAKVPQ